MCTPIFVIPLVFGFGCVGDDFGRTRQMFYHQDMHQWVGVEATTALGGMPSNFQLTDNERSLRDIAYYFIEPPHSRPMWNAVFGDYKPIPAPWRQEVSFDPTAYGRRMIDEPHRSQASSYQGMIEDIRNDFVMLEQFIPLAVKVNDIDIRRNKALGRITDLSPRENADAQARIRENVLVVQWAQQSVKQRAASYRWALQRLVIQAPDPMAAEVDRLIAELARRADAAWTSAAPVTGQVLRVGG
jgi:hypothetical protein